MQGVGTECRRAGANLRLRLDSRTLRSSPENGERAGYDGANFSPSSYHLVELFDRSGPIP